MVKDVTTRSLPIPGVPHRKHQVLLNGKVIHSQISALDTQDVALAVSRYEEAQRQARLQRQEAAQSRPTHAVCASCKKRKHVDEFAKDWSVRSGHKKDCKVCNRARRAA